MTAVAMILKPVDRGWVVALTDGRELARFTGFGARRRAIHYITDSHGFSSAAGASVRWARSRAARGLGKRIPPGS